MRDPLVSANSRTHEQDLPGRMGAVPCGEPDEP
jgi:hypothetical protein